MTGSMTEAQREEHRATLAAAAGAHERAGRPGPLLWLGAVVMLIGLVYMAAQLSARQEAVRRLSIETSRASLVEQLTLEIETARNPSRPQQTTDDFEPIPDALTRFQLAARQADLIPRTGSLTPDSAPPPSSGEDGFQTSTYRYSFTGKTPEDVLKFIEFSAQRIPGLKVRGVNISIGRSTVRGGRRTTRQASGPGATWNISVEFERTERTS
ncbi:MAG: hypothetical protein AAGB51_08020 [Planctomycetota bacterium]